MSRLIIVAHGSSVKTLAAQTIVDATTRLAEHPSIRGRFDQVECRFLKQAPLLSDVVWDTPTVVVPFFMADGYFVRKLRAQVPSDVRVTPPLGSADLSRAAVRVVERIDPMAHLVLVGHGTERDPSSAATVEALATNLRAELVSVTTAFVDQEPRLETTWERVPDDGCPVVILPYFAFAGPHTEDDIPEALGLYDLSGGPNELYGHPVYYAPPIGTAPEILDVLAELALTST